MGNAPHPELAQNFVQTIGRIYQFLKRTEAPFIAKIARPNDRDRELGRPGHVRMWLSWDEWARMNAARI